MGFSSKKRSYKVYYSNEKQKSALNTTATCTAAGWFLPLALERNYPISSNSYQCHQKFMCLEAVGTK